MTVSEQKRLASPFYLLQVLTEQPAAQIWPSKCEELLSKRYLCALLGLSSIGIINFKQLDLPLSGEKGVNYAAFRSPPTP
jgi:hypothetical protein